MTHKQHTFDGRLVSCIPVPVCADCNTEFPLYRAGELTEAHDGALLCADCAENYNSCENCGAIDHGNTMTDVDGSHYCEDCLSDLFVSCERCGDYISVDDFRSSDNGECYCETCYDRLFTFCADCETELPIDDAHRSNDGDYYCDSCYCERFNHCDSCGEEIDVDSSCYTDDGVYCASCNPVENEDTDEGLPVESPCDIPPGTYTELRSLRKFGIELETSSCHGYPGVAGKHGFHDKHDGSITGREFVTPHPIDGDDGLNAIRVFCALARSLNWTVNNDCGYHLHINARDLTLQQRKMVALAYLRTEDIWARFVPDSRVENTYCKPLDYCADEVLAIETESDWESFCNVSRYRWFNVAAYPVHGSFEIRLHTGTLNASKVCNWVKAHLRFVDWARNASAEALEGLDFAGLCAIWDDSALAEFYASRAECFGKGVR